MSTTIDNNEFRLGVGSIGKCSYNIFAASTYKSTDRITHHMGIRRPSRSLQHDVLIRRDSWMRFNDR